MSFFANPTPRRALRKARKHTVLASQATLQELIAVAQRPKWDRYVERSLRDRLVLEYIRSCTVNPTFSNIRSCRHPKDNKFLELAVDGRAKMILTGDNDLLSLLAFRGISILTPAEYLAQNI